MNDSNILQNVKKKRGRKPKSLSALSFPTLPVPSKTSPLVPISNLKVKNACSIEGTDQIKTSNTFDQVDQSICKSETFENQLEKREKKRKYIRVSDVVVDEYSWTQYGMKTLSNSFKRSYYRCKKKKQGCEAKKIMDIALDSNSVIQIVYEGIHNHDPPERPVRQVFVYDSLNGMIKSESPSLSPTSCLSLSEASKPSTYGVSSNDSFTTLSNQLSTNSVIVPEMGYAAAYEPLNDEHVIYNQRMDTYSIKMDADESGKMNQVVYRNDTSFLPAVEDGGAAAMNGNFIPNTHLYYDFRPALDKENELNTQVGLQNGIHHNQEYQFQDCTSSYYSDYSDFYTDECYSHQYRPCDIQTSLSKIKTHHNGHFS